LRRKFKIIVDVTNQIEALPGAWQKVKQWAQQKERFGS